MDIKFSTWLFYIPIYLYFLLANFRCVNTNQVTTTISIKKRKEKKKKNADRSFLSWLVVNFSFYIFQLVQASFFFPYPFTNYLVHNFFFLSITYTSDFSWRRRWSYFKKIFDPIIPRIRQWRVYIIIKTSPTRVSIDACNLWLIIERQITGVCAHHLKINCNFVYRWN
jgi:hypothetical protein